MTLIPTNGTMMPPSAVDEQVVAEQQRGADGAVLDAAQRERNEGDDDERVEDDRAQDRALRRREVHHVERVRAPGRSSRTPPG